MTTGPTMPAPGQPGAQFHPGAQWPPVPPRKKRRIWPWVVIGLVVLMFGGCMAIIGGAAHEVSKGLASTTALPAAPAPASSSAAASAPPAAQPPAAPAPAKPVALIGDGQYQVGTDIPAGRWKTAGNGDEMCYWARERNDSGELSAVIANNVAKGPQSATLKAGEFFEVSGGCRWALVP